MANPQIQWGKFASNLTARL